MSFKNKVTKLNIVGYKSIGILKDFKLNDLNIMIGSNGSGKSNFISLFSFLNEIAERSLQNHVQKAGGADKILHFGSKNTSSIEIKVEFSPNTYSCKLTGTDDDTLFFENEEITYIDSRYYNKPFSDTILSRDQKETGLKENIGQIAATTLSSFRSWKLYHFHDTSNTSSIKKMCSIDDCMNLRPDGSNLAAYLNLLQHNYPEEYNNIVDTIRLIAPFFDTFILNPSELIPDAIKLEWKHKNSDRYFDATALSDGTLRFICLVTLLQQPTRKLPTTILLDEPELGLHPAAIVLLANLLTSVASKTQVIVSTQSVTLINHLNPETIIVVDRDEKGSTFRRLTAEELQNWIGTYGLGDLWEKNIIGGRP